MIVAPRSSNATWTIARHIVCPRPPITDIRNHRLCHMNDGSLVMNPHLTLTFPLRQLPRMIILPLNGNEIIYENIMIPTWKIDIPIFLDTIDAIRLIGAVKIQLEDITGFERMGSCFSPTIIPFGRIINIRVHEEKGICQLL